MRKSPKPWRDVGVGVVTPSIPHSHGPNPFPSRPDPAVMHFVHNGSPQFCFIHVSPEVPMLTVTLRVSVIALSELWRGWSVCLYTLRVQSRPQGSLWSGKWCLVKFPKGKRSSWGCWPCLCLVRFLICVLDLLQRIDYCLDTVKFVVKNIQTSGHTVL